MALPGAHDVVIGDSGGHVHVMPASGGIIETQARSEDLSYLGHSDAVTQLAVNSDGSLVASAAADNSIRVWETELGKPRAFNVHLEGDAIRSLAFAPDLQVLASPLKFDGKRPPNRAAPLLGADSDALLEELGYEPGEIDSLRANGVI